MTVRPLRVRDFNSHRLRMKVQENQVVRRNFMFSLADGILSFKRDGSIRVTCYDVDDRIEWLIARRGSVWSIKKLAAVAAKDDV